MQTSTFTHAVGSAEAGDAASLFVRRFLPDGGKDPKGVVHVAHGMAEHGGRYARLAEALTAAGYAVYANDHRGHGRSASCPDELGSLGGRSRFWRAVRDLEELVQHEKREHPGLKIVLFGHSMGSFLVQGLLTTRGEALAGAILSGSGGKPGLLASTGRIVARAERRRLGDAGKSALLDALSFGEYNKAFAPNRTRFDWLSRDPAEVDAYVADPLCGFTCGASLWVDLLDGLAEIARPSGLARVPKDLPIYVFSGDRDPVGENGRSVTRLVEAYRKAGLRRVTQRLYPGGRHEMLNETNRDEVTRDLVAWLDGVFEGRA